MNSGVGTRSGTTLGRAILLTAALVWGIGNAVTGLTAVKYRSTGTMLPAVDIALANTIGGLALLLGLSWIRRLMGSEPTSTRKTRQFSLTVLAGGLKGLNTYLFVLSTSYILATEALVFECTYVLWVVLAALVFGKRRANVCSDLLRAWLLIAGAVLTASTQSDRDQYNLEGTVLALSAGLSLAAFLHVWSLVTDRLDSFAQQLGAAIRLLSVSALTLTAATELASLAVRGQPWFPFAAISKSDVCIQLVNGCMVVGVVYLLVTVGMKVVAASKDTSSVASAFCLSFSIPFTMLPEILSGRLIPSGRQLAGIALFMIAFVLLSLGRRTTKVEA